METSHSSKTVQVICYSGHTYAEWPKLLVWEGTEHRVEVENEWRGPSGRHFLVHTEEGRRFELGYDEVLDRWSALEI